MSSHSRRPIEATLPPPPPPLFAWKPDRVLGQVSARSEAMIAEFRRAPLHLAVSEANKQRSIMQLGRAHFSMAFIDRFGAFREAQTGPFS